MSNPTPPDAPDGYEARYMDAAHSLARSKKPMPWWFHALALSGAATFVGGAIATGHVAGLVTLPLLLLSWVLFTHLRINVTPAKVVVQLGLFGPTIPIEQIESVRAEKYNAMMHGGWGVRVGLNGTVAYSVPGGTGMAVRIEYRTAGGGRRVVLVSCDEAEAIVAAIERARAARAGIGVRVDAGATGGAGEGAAKAEAEAAADTAAARERDAR